MMSLFHPSLVLSSLLTLPRLLGFCFAICKIIIARAAKTYIISVISGQGIITAAAQDTVIAAKAVDRVRPGAANDQVIGRGAGHRAGPANYIRQVQPITGGRFEILRRDRNGLLPNVRGGHSDACCKS